MSPTTLTSRGLADWDVTTAARELELSVSSIRRAIASGQLKHRRHGPAGKLIRIKPEDGYAWLGLEAPTSSVA